MGCIASRPTSNNNAPEAKYITLSEMADLCTPQRTGTHSDAYSALSTVNEYITIDVRDIMMDYEGGKIIGSVNISDKIFAEKMGEILAKYNDKQKIILCDMYGARRCIDCFHHYIKCKKQIISNYSNRECTSHYTITNDEETRENSTIFINNCTGEMISNLSKQELLILKGGVFALLNSKYKNLIVDFDESKWEQLILKNLYKSKRWYHKNEFFAKVQFAELKSNTKSVKFKGESSKAHLWNVYD